MQPEKIKGNKKMDFRYMKVSLFLVKATQEKSGLKYEIKNLN